VSAGCEGRALGIAGELPRASPKRKPTAVKRVALVIASSSQVVLARRRREALFGGLWEPPAADGVDPRRLATTLGVEGVLRPGGRVVHVLSHRRMEVAVSVTTLGRRRRWSLPGDDYDAIEVVRIDEVASRAHSTLARKVLAVAGVLPLAKGHGAGLRSPST